jgi:RNA polymerase sigma-70 factor (ECF subfamily)
VADPQKESLESLIRGCVQKNLKAQEGLYKRYFGYAMSVALLYSDNRDEAMESVNDSFIKIFAEIRRFDTGKSFMAWLRRIVINTSIDRIRKNRRFKEMREDLNDYIPSGTPSAQSRLTAQDIMDLIKLLPGLHRAIFCLYDIEGYSHEEIAVKLKIPESSCRVYLSRARKRLRELYEFNFNDIS